MIGRLLLVAVAGGLFVASHVFAEEPVLLSMPEPPAGLKVSKSPLYLEEQVVGYHVQVADEEGRSKVLVQVETAQDLSEHSARIAALKGYVNGVANGLKGAGYSLVENRVPDVKQADFDRPQSVQLEFAKGDGSKLFVRQFVFFTDKGYNVQVVASDKTELERLSRWARHIRAAVPSAMDEAVAARPR